MNIEERSDLDFDCLPSRTVTLSVLDTDGRGCVAALTIKDKVDHIWEGYMYYRQNGLNGNGGLRKRDEREHGAGSYPNG
jgi:hypothetical protein